MLRDADPNYFKGIYIVCGYTDLRFGIDSLAAIIEQKYHKSLFVPNTLFLFCGKSASKIKGGRKTYMWVYRNRTMRTTYPIVLFDWQASRKADHPREFLKDFSGTVVTDGYQVYHKLADEREDLKVAGCWIHYPRSIVIPEASLHVA